MAALTLATEMYRDRILGGWQGKSAGATFGAGLRGHLTPGFLKFYNPVPGQPASSIALDFSVVWLSVVEQASPEITSELLKQAWLEKLELVQDEFGYATLNMRRGLPAPVCGAHSNWFRNGTGAMMRADLWAMLAPGNPQAAAALAYHDAVLDHAEEGVWAAMFLSAVGSAAFFLNEIFPLLTIGLAMIPKTCRSARAVKTALAAGQRGASWLEARESVQHEVGGKNFSDAPQNLGFLTLGLLYGQEFGASLCAAVNCGYDSEAVGAGLGALLGILRGASGLPADWIRPVGDLLIPGAGIRDSAGILSLAALAERTAAVGLIMARAHSTEIEITDEPAFAAPPAAAMETDQDPEDAPVPAGPMEPMGFVEFNAPPTDAPTPTAPVAWPSPTPAASEAVAEQPVEECVAASEALQQTPSPGETLEIAGTEPGADATVPVSLPTGFAPQPVSEEAQPLVETMDEPALQPAEPISAAPLAPDPMNAIAWADNTLVKPLLVTPTNAFIGFAGPFEVHMDAGESAAVAFSQVKTLAVTIFNRGHEAFTGRVSLLVPSGWQAAATAAAPRQYIAAHTGTLRTEFRLQVPAGQARIEIANALAVRLTPDDGAAPYDAPFVLMGASCWWTAGTFANFDGEGFDRSYTPEERPGLNESYVARNLQSVRWEKHSFDEIVPDLEPLFRLSSGVVYGQTILRCPSAREARLTASTNNGVKIWLNGSLALRRHQRAVFRPTLNDGNWTADVMLKTGDNPVMAKWVRGLEPYQFSLTVCDRNGQAMPDVGNTSW